jgi:hypothetical protein
MPIAFQLTPADLNEAVAALRDPPQRRAGAKDLPPRVSQWALVGLLSIVPIAFLIGSIVAVMERGIEDVLRDFEDGISEARPLLPWISLIAVLLARLVRERFGKRPTMAYLIVVGSGVWATMVRMSAT